MKFDLFSGGLLSFTRVHSYALYSQLDVLQEKPLKDGPSAPSSRMNRQFAFAAFIYALTILDLLFGMQYEYLGYLELSTILTCPYTGWNQFSPPLVAMEHNICMVGNSTAALLVYVLLTINCDQPEQCKLYPLNEHRQLQIGGRILGAGASRRMMRMSRTTRTGTKVLFTFFVFIVVYVYSYLNIFVTNGVYRVTVHSMVVIWIEFPIFFFYQIYGKMIQLLL